MKFLFLLDATVPTMEAITKATGGAGGATSMFGGSRGFGVILVYVVAIVGMFWFMGRNNRKKEKEQDELRTALKVGEKVMLNSGLFGVVTEVYDGEVVTVEFGTNKGVRIDVHKQAIASVGAPDYDGSIAEEVKNTKGKKTKKEKK